jgi:hypothetical protein
VRGERPSVDGGVGADTNGALRDDRADESAVLPERRRISDLPVHMAQLSRGAGGRRRPGRRLRALTAVGDTHRSIWRSSSA